MTSNALRDFIRVSLADGASCLISHPDFAFATGESLIVAAGPDNQIEGEFVVCPLQHITRVEILKRKLKSR